MLLVRSLHSVSANNLVKTKTMILACMRAWGGDRRCVDGDAIGLEVKHMSKRQDIDGAKKFMEAANKLYFWEGTTKEEKAMLNNIRARLLDITCPYWRERT